MAQNPPQNLTVYDVQWAHALVLCDPPSGAAPDWYDWELSEDGGTTWIAYAHNSVSTTLLFTGLTPGSTTNQFRVRAVSVANGTSSWVQSTSQTAPAFAANFKLEFDARTISYSATSGTVVCNIAVNMTGTVTWTLVAQQSNFGALPMAIASTGANTAQVTLTANYPATGGFNPSDGAKGIAFLAVRATNGTDSFGEVMWLNAYDTSAANTITNDILFTTAYSGANDHAVTIPADLPLGVPIAQWNGAAVTNLWPGRGSSPGTNIVDLFMEVPSAAAYAFGFDVEHNQTDGARLIYANALAAGSYAPTLGAMADGWNADSLGVGEVQPFKRTMTIAVLTPAVGASISFSQNSLSNGSAIGTAVGTATVTGLSGTVVWSICPDFHDRAEQYAMAPGTGALTTAKNLSHGADALYLIASNGTNAVWKKIWLTVDWATPTTSDPAFSGGATTVGAGQTYTDLSSIFNQVIFVNGAGPMVTLPNQYSGMQLNWVAATYANDDRGKSGVSNPWEGYISSPTRIVGQLGVGGAMPLLTCDLGWPSDFVLTVNNSKSNLDISQTDLTLTNVAVQGFQAGFTELFGSNLEAEYGAGKRQFSNCFFSNNDTSIINGYPGHRSEFYCLIVSYGGCNFEELGQTHNIYENQDDVATLTNVLSMNVTQGHLLKARGFLGVVREARLLDIEGCKSYDLDLPFGGIWYVLGGFFYQGPNSSNFTILQFNEEIRVRRWKHILKVDGGTWRNDNANTNSQGYNALATNMVCGPMPYVEITNVDYWNLPTSGSGGFIVTTGGVPNSLVQSGNTSLSVPPAYDTSSPFVSGAVPPDALPALFPDHAGIGVLKGPSGAFSQQPGPCWDVYVGDIDLEMAYDAPAGTVLCTPYVGGALGQNLGGGYVTAGASSGATSIAPTVPSLQVGAVFSAHGFDFIATGLAGSSVTGIQGGSSPYTGSVPVTALAGTISTDDNYSFPSPFGGSPTLTWSDSAGAFTVSGANIVRTSAALSPDTVLVGTLGVTAPNVELVGPTPAQTSPSYQAYLASITKLRAVRITQGVSPMANLAKWAAGASPGATYTACFGSEINSLPTGDGVLSSIQVDNSTNLDLYANVSFAITLASSASAGAYIQFFLVPLNVDGTTYGDGGMSTTASTPSAGLNSYMIPGGQVLIEAGTTTVVGTLRGIDMFQGKFKLVVLNVTGEAFAASGNSIEYTTWCENLNG